MRPQTTEDFDFPVNVEMLVTKNEVEQLIIDLQKVVEAVS